MLELTLTRSQQMALIDILMAYLRLEDQPQEFINCSSSEEIVTTTGELLSLIAQV